jgi:uncharacterized protein
MFPRTAPLEPHVTWVPVRRMGMHAPAEEDLVTTDTATPTVAERITALDWPDLDAQLDEQGFAQTPVVYRAGECRELAGTFESGRFRSRVDMRRHRFGEGEYKYFDAPLPALIDEARHALYPPLAEVANEWARRLGEPADLPPALDDFLDRCHAAGQRRPTPLLLRYFEGGHNTLHQDLYGDVAFPLQAVTLLNRPGTDFEGGEFVLVEQRPRAQSRAHVIELERGAFVIFPTRQRPVRGTRGDYRTAMRHGVATVRSGERITLGIIFHDAV